MQVSQTDKEMLEKLLALAVSVEEDVKSHIAKQIDKSLMNYPATSQESDENVIVVDFEESKEKSKGI